MRLALSALALLAAGLATPAAAQVQCGIPGVTVTLSPANPAPGQPVAVTLANGTNSTITLPTSCVISAVFSGGSCSGAPVFAPLCLQVLTPIAPGTSKTQAWDQTDDNGVPVQPGNYSIEVRYFDGAFNIQSCCVPFTIGTSGQVYCSGDGSGTPCPCGNTGSAGAGCANGTFPSGAALSASGQASVGADSLVLQVADTTPGQPGLFFQGDNALNGGAGVPFGDGLRCAGGNVVRLEVRFAGNAGTAATTVAIGATGGVSAGDVRRYQWWYRDPVLSPCGTGFNFSNGLEVTWAP